MALDLSAPLTYAADLSKLDCNPDPAVESACPFQQVDASGLARVITSLPLAADRVLFRQSARDVLVADAEISSPVQIATSSGFLALSIEGDLELTQGTGEHLQTLALTKGTAEIPVYIPVPAFVEQVRLQASPHHGVDRRRLLPEARGRGRGDDRRQRRRLRGRPRRGAVHRADPDRHGRQARRRHPGNRRQRRRDEPRRGRPAQGAQLRARQPDVALRRRARGLQERRERPHHDDGWRPRRADPVRRVLGQPADRCRCQWRRGSEVRTGRRNGGRPGHGQHPGGGRRPRDDHADGRQADLHPCVHRPPDRGRLDHRHHRRPGRAHPHPGPAARLRAGRRHRLPRAERAPGCRQRAHRLHAGHAAGSPRHGPGLAGQQLDHRLRAGRQRRRQAAPRPDLGAQVRRLATGQPRPGRLGAGRRERRR